MCRGTCRRVRSALHRSTLASAQTLQQALLAAYKYNPRIDAMRARLRATNEQVARAIRKRLKMAQREFADCFGFKLRSVQNWEQGRPPDAVANNYLRFIASDPEVAKRAQLEKLP